jgi:hypothetical protein
VRRKIVQYDVNFPSPFRLSDQPRQESDKFGAGMPLRSFPSTALVLTFSAAYSDNVP